MSERELKRENKDIFNFEKAKVIKSPPPPKFSRPLVQEENAGEKNKKMEEARKELAEKELMSRVLSEAAINVLAWFPKGIAEQPYDGYEHIKSDRSLNKKGVITALDGHLKKQLGVYIRDDLSSEMRKHDINEFIDIRHFKTEEHETITIPGKKGFLGIGREPDREEKRRTGRYKNLMHSSLAENGKREPAVCFFYEATGEGYTDAFSRHEKVFTAVFILPETTAKDLERTLETNPVLMRELVEKAMKEKVLKNPSDWEKVTNGKGDELRPPWEKWDAEPGGSRIYIQKEGNAPGWHEEFVQTIKSQ